MSAGYGDETSFDMPQESRTVRVRREMGQRFKVLRLALGMTQLQMSDVMGVSCPTISAWESGRNPIDLVILAQAAERFGFTTDYIARGDAGGIPSGLAAKLVDCRLNLPARSPRGRPTLGTRLSEKSGPSE